MRRTLSFLLILASCAAAFSTVNFSATVISPPLAADTLVMSATWTLPTDDGRGPLDSLRVAWHGIQKDSTLVYVAPFPTSGSLRLVIPASAYPGGTTGQATYSVLVMVTTIRRGTFAPIQSAPVNIVLGSVPPPPVTGLIFQATKIP